jgi:hypothetical protein
MILMALFSMAIIFGMPYLMENSTLPDLRILPSPLSFALPICCSYFYPSFPLLSPRLANLALAVDPETKAEFDEIRSKGVLSSGTGATNPADALQNFDLASWMAGKTERAPSPAAVEPEKAQGGGKKGKR